MLSFLTFTTLAIQFFLASSLAVERRGRIVGDMAPLMKLPPTVPAPTAPLSFVAAAIGTQNYTCSSTGTYTNVGAVAELFDISGLINIPIISDEITNAAIAVWKIAPASWTPQKVISALSMFKGADVLGQHYYVQNGAGVSPKWDFIASQHNPDATVVAAKSVGVAAPAGSKDIDWVMLNAIDGKLADQIYRTDTKLGQPPASCTPGSAPITVKYAAKYWLFGGSIKH